MCTAAIVLHYDGRRAPYACRRRTLTRGVRIIVRARCVRRYDNMYIFSRRRVEIGLMTLSAQSRSIITVTNSEIRTGRVILSRLFTRPDDENTRGWNVKKKKTAFARGRHLILSWTALAHGHSARAYHTAANRYDNENNNNNYSYYRLPTTRFPPGS